MSGDEVLDMSLSATPHSTASYPGAPLTSEGAPVSNGIVHHMEIIEQNSRRNDLDHMNASFQSMESLSNDEHLEEGNKPQETETSQHRQLSSRWLKRNETAVHCCTVRDLHLNSCMVPAVATDKGIHLFIPRFLCMMPVRNAIYRQILVPPPCCELREFLATKMHHSYSNIAMYSNLLVYRRVRWAHYSLHLAALTNDGQLMIFKADLSRNSSKSFPVCNVSKFLLESLSLIPHGKPPAVHSSQVRSSSEAAEVIHFCWVEMPQDLQYRSTVDVIVVLKSLRVLYVQVDFETLDPHFVSLLEIGSCPGTVIGRKTSSNNLELIVGFTNGCTSYYLMNQKCEIIRWNNFAIDDDPDYVPVTCAVFLENAEFAAVSKANEILLFSLISSDSTRSFIRHKIDSGYTIYRIEYRNDTLFWCTKNGELGAISCSQDDLRNNQVDEESLKAYKWRESIVVNSKGCKYTMGALAEQCFTGLCPSENFEFLFYIYDDEFVEKRQFRDFQLVCMSTASKFDEKNSNVEKSFTKCSNSDFIFNEKWFSNSLYLDHNAFSSKLWPNKVEIISASMDAKFTAESIEGCCGDCAQNIVSLSTDLTGYCSEGHDWPICFQGHVILEPHKISVCLMCRILYCLFHKPRVCFCCSMLS